MFVFGLLYCFYVGGLVPLCARTFLPLRTCRNVFAVTGLLPFALDGPGRFTRAVIWVYMSTFIMGVDTGENGSTL